MTLGTQLNPPGPGPRPLRLCITCSLLLPLSSAFPDLCVGAATPSFGAQGRGRRRDTLTCTNGSPNRSTGRLEYREACEDPERPSWSKLSQPIGLRRQVLPSHWIRHLPVHASRGGLIQRAGLSTSASCWSGLPRPGAFGGGAWCAWGRGWRLLPAPGNPGNPLGQRRLLFCCRPYPEKFLSAWGRCISPG